MISITTVLVAEHKMFCGLFDHIQQVLLRAESLAEVKCLARMVEGLLRNHAKAEEDLFLHAHACAGKAIIAKDGWIGSGFGDLCNLL